MPNNSFSIGHDVSLDIVDGRTGKLINFPLVTGFDAQPITKTV